VPDLGVGEAELSVVDAGEGGAARVGLARELASGAVQTENEYSRPHCKKSNYVQSDTIGINDSGLLCSTFSSFWTFCSEVIQAIVEYKMESNENKLDICTR